MKKFLALALILSGCIGSPPALYVSDWQTVSNPENYIKVDNYPKYDTKTLAKLGNTLALKSSISVEPVLKINSSFNYGYNNSLNRYIENKSKSLFPYKNTLKNNFNGELLKCYENIYVKEPLFAGWFDLCVDNKKNIKYRSQWEKIPYIIYGEFNTVVYVVDGYKEIISFEATFQETAKNSHSEMNFKQEFIYNGRVNNSLKFIYREFSGELVKPSVTQEVQYDLNQSNIIGFKNLSIEILNATNQEIEYKVITPF